MKTIELERRFREFLVQEKGYPLASLLHEVLLESDTNNPARADLLIVDMVSADYLGLVEFKTVPIGPRDRDAHQQVSRYLQVLRTPDLPAYLIQPGAVSSFSIQVYISEGWREITPEQFPSYNELVARRRVTEKVLEKEEKEKLLLSAEERRYRAKRLSLWTLTSLVVGVMAALISTLLAVYTDGGGRPLGSCDCERIDSLSSAVASMESKLATALLEVDSIRTPDSSAVYLALAKRVSRLDSLYHNSSERLVVLEGIRGDINVLRAQMEGQEKLLNERHGGLTDRVSLLTGLVIGLIFALFSAAIGWVITVYNERRRMK